MKYNTKITILDEVNIRVTGLLGKHNEHFVNKYSLFSKNYFFNPKYKLGRWDGKIAHFSKSGQTYLYILPEILSDLIKFGYEIDIEDKRTSIVITPDPINEDIFANIIHPDTNKPIKLRSYQVDAINNILPDGNGTILAATGAGKTIICAAILQAYTKYNIKSITIVPDQNLIIQTKKTFILCNLDVGEYSGKNKDINHQHVVSTWQALQHNPALVSMFDLVIVDECHKLSGSVLKTLICDRASNLPYRFGVTGTLPKEPIDELGVKISVGPVKYEIPAHKLIDSGVLAKLDISVLQLEENLIEQYNEYVKECIMNKPVSYSKFKDQYFPDYSIEKSYLQHNDHRIQWIADKLISTKDEKGNVLCLVNSIPVARKLAKIIPNAYCVNGQDVKDPKKRQETYDLFETQNDLIVIATVHIAGTGLSINRIFSLFSIDMGRSFSQTIQVIGRGLRTSSDKHDIVFYDVCGDLKCGKKHLKERIQYYDEAKYPYKIHKIKYN